MWVSPPPSPLLPRCCACCTAIQWTSPVQCVKTRNPGHSSASPPSHSVIKTSHMQPAERERNYVAPIRWRQRVHGCARVMRTVSQQNYEGRPLWVQPVLFSLLTFIKIAIPTKISTPPPALWSSLPTLPLLCRCNSMDAHWMHILLLCENPSPFSNASFFQGSWLEQRLFDVSKKNWGSAYEKK